MDTKKKTGPSQAKTLFLGNIACVEPKTRLSFVIFRVLSWVSAQHTEGTNDLVSRQVWWRSWRSWGWTIWPRHPTRRRSAIAKQRRRENQILIRNPQGFTTSTSLTNFHFFQSERCPLGCCGTIGTGPRYSSWRRWSHGWSLSTPFCTLDQMSNESNASNGSKCVQLFFCFYVFWSFFDVFCWCVHFSVWFGRVVCVPLNTEDHMILSFSGWVFKWILNIRAGTVGSGASWLLPVCWVWKLDFGRWWWAVGNSSVDPRHCSTWNPSPFGPSCHFVSVEGCQCTKFVWCISIQWYTMIYNDDHHDALRKADPKANRDNCDNRNVKTCGLIDSQTERQLWLGRKFFHRFQTWTPVYQACSDTTGLFGICSIYSCLLVRWQMSSRRCGFGHGADLALQSIRSWASDLVQYNSIQP